MRSSAAIPFEAFMEHALYDPQRGYYSRRITGVGRKGDFTTAPMLSEAPARAIASWAADALKQTGCRNLIEIGPGEGALAAAVLKHLPWHRKWNLRLHLVETSAPLAEIQKKHLGNKAVWHATPGEALAACGGNAVIYSNELVDAFPVRRFRKTELGWQELAVSFQPDGSVEESLLSPAPLPSSSGFLDHHPMGQWIEVHDSYHRWLSTWLPEWRSGKMLTIDYGSTAETLYHRRPRGTLRAYLMQQRLEGPEIYQNTGRQDLTADVNFTDLMKWSEPWVKSQKLENLTRFLQSGICGLSDEQGAGGAFLVLDQTCACA